MTRPNEAEEPAGSADPVDLADASLMPDANDTSTVPHRSPKIAPPTIVMIAAPGSESPVTAT